MKILLIANFPLDRQESMLRFARAMRVGLEARSNTVDVWSPSPWLSRIARYRYAGLPKYLGYFDKFVRFPWQVRVRLAKVRRTRDCPEIVHIVDHANAVYAPLFDGLPLVVTCHDLLQVRASLGEFPVHSVAKAGQTYQRWILRHLKRLNRITCNSTQTRDDVHRLAEQPRANLSVLPLSLNHPYKMMAPSDAASVIGQALLRRKLPADLLDANGAGFLLNIGGGQWYKNTLGMLNIFAELRSQLRPCPRLLMVGKPLSPVHASQVLRLGLGESFAHLGSVSEIELQALYSKAEGLLFPSWHEGFGWPLVEAQSCGCPVFTSNRAPMTEVAGRAAVYIDPADPISAAAQIAASWIERPALRRLGLERAAYWHPMRMIDDYAARYSAAIRGEWPEFPIYNSAPAGRDNVSSTLMHS